MKVAVLSAILVLANGMPTFEENPPAFSELLNLKPPTSTASVTPTEGIQNIGYLLIVFGTAAILMSIACIIGKCTTRSDEKTNRPSQLRYATRKAPDASVLVQSDSLDV